MNKNPIVFAMANPDPEIDPPVAKQVRPDVIIATGRSDYPNQVNNVLGFPSIFRGALDTRATQINEEMKLAAVHALAELAREDVPESVSAAYSNRTFHFGPEYIIPKPFDNRVLLKVAPAVAKAAMESAASRKSPSKIWTPTQTASRPCRAARAALSARMHQPGESQSRRPKVGRPPDASIFPKAAAPRFSRPQHLIERKSHASPCSWVTRTWCAPRSESWNSKTSWTCR